MKKLLASLLLPSLCFAEPASAPSTTPSTQLSCEDMLQDAGQDALRALESARCAEKLNMIDLARRAYEKAISLAPTAEWAASVRLRLSELRPKSNQPQVLDETDQPTIPREQPLVARGPHQLLYGLSAMSVIFGLIFHSASNSRETVLELAGTGTPGQPPAAFDAGFQRIEAEGERLALAAQIALTASGIFAVSGFLLRPQRAKKLSLQLRNLHMIEVKLEF
jgi:hypothetical protein